MGRERGRKRGAMAAALAYYARRERRRRMFLKHVRHALRRFTDRVMTSPQLSPRLSSSRFFFSFYHPLFVTGRLLSPLPYNRERPTSCWIGSCVAHARGTCNCSVYDPCIDMMNFFGSFSLLYEIFYFTWLR